MAKIKTQLFKKNLEVVQSPNGNYRVHGIEWWKTSSAHGQSRGVVICPACTHSTDIYIWSFCGGGKRCSGCNLLLTSGAGYFSKEELPKGFDFSTLNINIQK